MREYIPTEAGEQLARDTGLDKLADRLSNQDYERPLHIIKSLVQESVGWWDVSQEEISENISQTRSTLKTPEELEMFDQGLSIDLIKDTWRRLGDLEEATLFPIREIASYAPATETDQLILSGAAGLSLTNFRQHYPLLARSRYEEYGFRTFNESCAFVGAYVVGKLLDKENRRLRRETPSFEYSDNGVTHSVSVGGTFHGDFQMKEFQTAQCDIISPAHTRTEFGPQKVTCVAGYHSIEPEIVATLIEAEFIQAGKEAALELVDEFMRVLRDSADTSGNITSQRGNFGDYGDGDVKYSLISLRLLVSEKSYNPLRIRNIHHSSRYAPQSSTMFEIVPVQNGVKFQNRDEKSNTEVEGIQINRERYPELFRTLVQQTSGGLGRTSPDQIIQLVCSAKDILEQRGEDLEFDLE